jgi:uncharacterized membrane protein YdjX (TVP38/TMEM64 family)
VPEKICYNQAMLEALSSLEVFAHESGSLGLAVCFLLYTLAVVLIFPGLWMGLLCGHIYGTWWGMAILFPGSILGASLSFLLGRYVVRDHVLSHIHVNKSTSHDLKKISEAFSSKGMWFTALLFASPLAPFRLLSYVAGTTQMPFKDFVLALVLSVGPHMLPVAYAGSLAKNVGDIVKDPSSLLASIGSVPYLLGLFFTLLATLAVIFKVQQVLKKL